MKRYNEGQAGSKYSKISREKQGVVLAGESELTVRVGVIPYLMSLPPTNWPRKKAPIITGKLISCHPSPEKMRQAMTRGTGRWIASIHGKENLRTRLRQYPNGRFKTKTIAATIHNVIRSV